MERKMYALLLLCWASLCSAQPTRAPQQYAPVVIAQVSQAQRSTATVDRTIGVCHLATNRADEQNLAFNGFSPELGVRYYFRKFEHKEIGLGGKVTVLQGPTHGTLESGGLDWAYHPTIAYKGIDQATFLVEAGGFKVKVIIYFNVMNGVPGGTDGADPYQDKKFCPQGGMWKISLTQDDPPAQLADFLPPNSSRRLG